MNVNATLGDTLSEQVTATLRNAYNASQNKLDPVLAKVYAAATKVHNALVSAGLSEPAASYATYESYHETGAFTSPLFLQHNNASGIKYAKQSGAVRLPDGYAGWPGGLSGWAAAMKHEATKGANPAGATTLEDYVSRLKKNKYFEDSESNYLSGLKRARLVLKDLPATMRAGQDGGTVTQAIQDNDIPGTKVYATGENKIKEMWGKLPTAGKVGVGAVAVIVLVKIFN